MAYKVEIHDGSQWDDAVGKDNAFDTEEEAALAIEGLREIEGWEEAVLRVVEK